MSSDNDGTGFWKLHLHPYLAVPLISARVPLISTRVSAHCQTILLSTMIYQFPVYVEPCKNLINQAAGMRTTSGQRDFEEETISTHHIEEFAEFFALVDL